MKSSRQGDCCMHAPVASGSTVDMLQEQLAQPEAASGWGCTAASWLEFPLA